MTLTIIFAPDEEDRLRQRAAEIGKDVVSYVHDAALASVDGPAIAQILAPVHESTLRADASVDEIDQMADRAREEVRHQRRTSNPHRIG